jgi:hypothetical protein
MRLARRATRRLLLGEPPLVITTHAITSFRSSLPEPAGDQPRAGSGSSPSCHGSTTRKSVRRCVSCLDRHRYFIQRHGRIQQSKAKKSKAKKWIGQNLEPAIPYHEVRGDESGNDSWQRDRSRNGDDEMGTRGPVGRYHGLFAFANVQVSASFCLALVLGSGMGQQCSGNSAVSGCSKADRE